jgi:nucleolar protein 9
VRATEKALFIGNLHREAVGKELKIAHSQGCSRLLERLILLSTPAQLKALFQSFSGQYAFLVSLPAQNLRADILTASWR